MGSGFHTFQTAGYEALASDEKAMLDDEHVRLLYVATTRAMDHLVLSVYRSLRGDTDATYIASQFEGSGDMWRQLPDPTEQQSPLSDLTDGKRDDKLDQPNTPARLEHGGSRHVSR